MAGKSTGTPSSVQGAFGSPAERFGFALALPADHEKIVNMTTLFGDGEVFGVIRRCRECCPTDATASAAASALLGILQLALDQHHRYLGVESLRWVQVVVPGQGLDPPQLTQAHQVSVPSLVFGPAVSHVVAFPAAAAGAPGSVVLVPHPEVDWTASAAMSEPPQFMPGVPFVPFEGAYQGQDATGLAQKLEKLKSARDGSGNPVLDQTVKHLSFDDCGRALEAILDTPQVRANNAAAAAAAGITVEELQAKQGAKRAEEEKAAVQAQSDAQAAACRGLIAAGAGAGGGGAAVKAATASTESLSEAEAETRLKKIPAASRRAAVADLAARAAGDNTGEVKRWNDLRGWREKLEVVSTFLAGAKAAGVSPSEYGARQAAARGDPPAKEDDGCVCA